MNEDPFDQMCFMIIAMIVFAERMTTLMLQEAWISARYRGAVTWLRTRHVLVVMRLKAKSLWVRIYYQHIRVQLELMGMVRALTWADVEAMRLRCSARTGIEIPRPKELEEGLRREKAWRDRGTVQEESGRK